MDLQSVLFAAVACVIIAWLIQTWRLARLRQRPGQRARRRARRGLQGEAVALRLLEQANFRVIAEQPKAKLTVYSDGCPTEVALRADFLVEQQGLRFIADAKTGSLAASLRHGPTRRQLLEYALVFEADGVLLVDVEARVVRTVRFEW